MICSDDWPSHDIWMVIEVDKTQWARTSSSASSSPATTHALLPPINKTYRFFMFCIA